ncbi:uncharacterized protein LOC135846251 isoform X2 [Planococcus citri]|uniref:uncharacterized protein LOC135846251 isoform X2 n=1 Tax=Planococcus citri TaxID=170843 RepID=UPI0031F883C1
MIHRSSSSRRRKLPRTTSGSPHRSTGSLARKQSVAFESLQLDEKFEPLSGEKRDKKHSIGGDAETYISGSGGGGASRVRGGSSSNLSEYSASLRSSSITVTATDEHNTPTFPVYSPERLSGGNVIENAISLSEFPPSQKSSRSSNYDAMRSSRNSVTPDDSYLRGFQQNTDSMTRKSRSSLTPEVSKSPRSSLVPDDAYNRSPRGSIDPAVFNRGSRNSLFPDPEQYNRQSRPSMVADVQALRNSRNSLVPDVSPNRSPRNSLVPESSNRNLLPEGANRTPRGSLVPDTNRSPRNSLVPDGNRTPRGSLVADMNRTPRGSVTSEGSMYSYNRSSRSSLPLQDGTTGILGKSPRGSIASATGVQFDLSVKTPRGSVESVPPGVGRLSHSHRSASPFHTGSVRGNLSTANHSNTDEKNSSRRASSSVSQVSADDRRHLCEHTKLNPESGLGLTAYGSFVYQLNHANMESTSTFDFVLKALRIIYRTAVVTVILVFFTLLSLIMLIMGVNDIRECPLEPKIPLYLIVGGCFGLLQLIWVLWRQVRSLRYERLNPRDLSHTNSDEMLAASIAIKIGSFLLFAFLVVWFVFGNYWILHIYPPNYDSTNLYHPKDWCSKTLYIFSIVHLIIIYSAIGVVIVVTLVMAVVQICLLRCR